MISQKSVPADPNPILLITHDHLEICLGVPGHIDYIIHLAAAISVAESMTNPEKCPSCCPLVRLLVFPSVPTNATRGGGVLCGAPLTYTHVWLAPWPPGTTGPTSTAPGWFSTWPKHEAPQTPCFEKGLCCGLLVTEHKKLSRSCTALCASIGNAGPSCCAPGVKMVVAASSAGLRPLPACQIHLFAMLASPHH